MDAKTAITEAVKQALAELGIEGVTPVLERPADMTHGDYATGVALAAAKQVGKSPHELAEAIVGKLPAMAFVEKIEVAGPGFINFYLTRDYFLKNLREMSSDSYGKGSSFAGEKVFIEYTQPNAFKEMHVGHLVNNIVGESVSRLIEWGGADVRRTTYHGDKGLHVAKAVWVIRKDGLDPTSLVDLNTAYAEGARAYEEDASSKQEIIALNKAIYEGSDPEANAIYETGLATSLGHIRSLCERLGSTFDDTLLESEAGDIGKKVVEEHIDDGIFEKSDGAVIFPGEKHGLHTRVFISSEGLPTYEAKDLGLIVLKRERYPFTQAVILTDIEQASYFSVIKKAIELVFPELEGHVRHVAHGRLRLTSGRISSRKGNNPLAEELLNGIVELSRERTSEEKAGEHLEAIAEDIAVAALKYVILRQSTGKNIVFDEEKSLSFEGDSGPYIQYTTVRARSVVAKAKDAGIAPSFDIAPEEAGIIERLLERFPEVAERAANEYEPHHIATYAIEMASAFNSWYAGEKIIDTKDALSPYRVALTDAVAAVLSRALWLLGIRVPEAM